MLDVNDFIAERGGNPETIRESQRRRFASVEIVDEIIALFEDHRKSVYSGFFFSNNARRIHKYLQMLTFNSLAQYNATQINSQINDVQKQIGAKKKV